jgi:hypothetical protein
MCRQVEHEARGSVKSQRVWRSIHELSLLCRSHRLFYCNDITKPIGHLPIGQVTKWACTFTIRNGFDKWVYNFEASLPSASKQQLVFLS